MDSDLNIFNMERLFNREAEQSVLGSLLIDSRCADDVFGLIRPSFFWLEQHQQIAEAIYAVYSNDTEFDSVTVLNKMRENGTYSDGTRNYCIELMNVTPTAANVSRYARIVREYQERRTLYDAVQTSLESLTGGTENAATIRGFLVDQLDADARTIVGDRCLAPSDYMRCFVDDLADRENGRKNVVPSGFPRLDALLGGGFLNGGLYIIAARPAMGKSTFAINLADNIEGAVLFVSLEMAANQITAKRVAARTKINSKRLLSSSGFTDAEWGRIAAATSDISQGQVYVNRVMGSTVSEIASMARSIKGLSAIVVDYLTLIRPENKRATAYEAASEISGALKRLAMRLNIPVIALSQLNRGVEQRQDKRPLMSDLRESGSIEQDADSVLLLYREDYYHPEQKNPDPLNPSLVEVNIAKNRHGEPGMVRFNSYLAYSMFSECKE